MNDKKLIDVLNDLYTNYNFNKCLEYFSNGSFLDDCEKYFDNKGVDDILDYITDVVYEINTIDKYRFSNTCNDKLKKMLQTCIKKLR